MSTDLQFRLEVTSGPWLSLRLDGGFREDPYPATMARMLHTAASARTLPPGLHRVIDAPPRWG